MSFEQEELLATKSVMALPIRVRTDVAHESGVVRQTRKGSYSDKPC